MPPQIKVERTQILEAGLEIIRKEGAERLNARDLAKALECSVQPIFKNFESMEALKRELYDDAAELFQEAVEREAEKHGVPFLGKYLALIEFANEDRQLYHFLHHSGSRAEEGLFDRMGREMGDEQIALLCKLLTLEPEQAKKLFEEIWFITQGLAALVSFSPEKLGEQELVKVLNTVVDAFLAMGKAHKLKGEA